MSSSNEGIDTAIIDDFNVNYNTSRDAAQAIAPTSLVVDSVNVAKRSAWNDSLVIVTTPTSFWYRFKGVTRVAVYGSALPQTALRYTAWANYTIGGNYTAGNVTTVAHVITDFPLFVSEALDPTQAYNLTVDIAASPDAPYIFDYLLAYSLPAPTPFVIITSSTTQTSISATSTPTPQASSHDSPKSFLQRNALPVVIGMSAVAAVCLIAFLLTLCCFCWSRKSRPKSIEAPVVPPEPPFQQRPTSKVTTISSSSRTTSTLGASSRMESNLGAVNQSIPSPSFHQRSATMPIPYVAPNTAPVPAMKETQHIRSPALLRSATSPRLVLPSGMGTPTAVRLPEPFATPPAGEIIRADTPLQNPYDALYGNAVASSAGASASVASPHPASTQTPSAVSSVPATSSIPPTTSLVSTPSSTSAMTTTAMASSSAIPSSVVAPAGPVATTSQPITSVAVKLGPNEYPKEKQEIRLEPPKQNLYDLNSDIASPSSGDADSPPAYSS